MIPYWNRFFFAAFQPLPESPRDQWLCIHLVHGWRKSVSRESVHQREGMEGRPPQVSLEKAEKDRLHAGYGL